MRGLRRLVISSTVSSRVSFALTSTVSIALLVSGLALPAQAGPVSGLAAAATVPVANAGALPDRMSFGQTDPAPPPTPSMDGVPQRDLKPAGVGSPLSQRRLRELPAKRTKTAKVFELEDGRLQAELSTAPVHYMDAAGVFQPIDTAVKPNGKDGFSFANETNTYDSYFGTQSSDLVRFKTGAQSVTVGPRVSKALTPVVDGDVVRYRDVFGSADLVYAVEPDALKEGIVLDTAPVDETGATFVFDLKLAGVVARAQADGSIGFFRNGGDNGVPVFVIPKPFMVDAASEFSPAVTQTVTQSGANITVTVRADVAWLQAPGRVWPVVIDPTIRFQPEPEEAQDAFVDSVNPNTNMFGGVSSGLYVGTTSNSVRRSLLKFDLTNVPKNTPIDSAQLQLYFDQVSTTNANAVKMEARAAKASWTESTVTWNDPANASNGQVAYNLAYVDDSYTPQVSSGGVWPTSASTGADYGSVHYNKDSIDGESFSFWPRVTETGSYDVSTHYTAGLDRATNVPYGVAHDAGLTNYTVDQTAVVPEGWKLLGTHTFTAGSAARVSLGDIPNKSVIADSVKLVKWGQDTKSVNQTNAWHYYSIRNLAQGWVNDSSTNFGVQIKATDESLGRGGPVYQASEHIFGGSQIGRYGNRPRLMLTFGKPGATLHSATTIYGTGAQLDWDAYVDPSPSQVTGDDIVEYQVHRSTEQNFAPSQDTLVAPVAPTSLAYRDTSGEPTPADSTDPEGDLYYYMVAVKTRSGELIASATQPARLPKAGRTVKFFQAPTDTTLSSTRSTTNLDVLEGKPWLQTGLDPTYGKTRTVVDFAPQSTGQLSASIPQNAVIADAAFGLWRTQYFDTTTEISAHALNRDFGETTATWTKADSANNWTTAGGDYNPTAFARLPASDVSANSEWTWFDATTAVQGWITNPATDHGILVKHTNEAVNGHALYLSAEGSETTIRPVLRVTYIVPTTESTYHAPSTPPVLLAGQTYSDANPAHDGIDVTVTNTTTAPMDPAVWALSYHWIQPDGTDVTTTANRLDTPLPRLLAPGETVKVRAQVKAPDLADPSNNREDFTLKWDLHKNTGAWLSTSGGVDGLSQHVAVEGPTSDELGLEDFYQYVGKNTGAGSAALVNTHTGNVVFGYNPFSNPSRGASTFARMTYNSLDTSSSSMGYGWSLSTSTVQRLGSALDFHPPGQKWPREISLTDGDGTTHLFTLDKHGVDDESKWDYTHPHGVHLHLDKVADPPDKKTSVARAWRMTRPDRTEFYFDDQGFQTAIVDKNGNATLFMYEERNSNNKPVKFLKYITDPAGRQTLTLDYYEKGQDYAYINDAGVKVNDTHLTNPKIIDQVESLTDITGRVITFTYTDKGLMAELVDGAGADQQQPPTQPKTFRFSYDATNTNKNTKLVKVTDPRGHATDLAYFDAPTDAQDKWKLQTLTDRLGKATGYDYIDPDGPQGGQIWTHITDPNGKLTKYLTDTFGRPATTINAKNETTQVGWDADFNLTRLEEPNGAVTTWTYDPNTGYPLTITDAEANANTTEPTELTYFHKDRGVDEGPDPFLAELETKKTPEGRTWTFGHDPFGNLTTVTDPKGTATPTVGDYTTTYTYDPVGQLDTATDANNHTTRYDLYDPTGYPTRITDALQKETTFEYDDRGAVRSVEDALHHTSTYTYDTFGRPGQSVVPVDTGANRYITTDAPEYDTNDNVTVATAPNGAVTTNHYDAADQLDWTLAPKDTPTDPERKTSYTYDAVGNLKTQTEPRGNLTPDPGDFITTYGYDDIYQLTSVKNAAQDQITYTYNNVGDVDTVVDPRKNKTQDLTDFTTKYTYDLAHRVKTVTDAAGKVTSSGYDLDGNVIEATDADNNTTIITLDERAKPVQVKVPHTTDTAGIVYHITQYDYDQAGNRTKTISPRGVETTTDPTDFTQVTVYDELNRVAEQQAPFDADDPDYNTADTTQLFYDAVGNLTTVSAPPSDGQTARNDTKYDYFDNGWVKTSTDPWDIATSYGYNDLGQQTGRTLTSAGGSSSRTMTWDFYPDGKLKARSDDGVPVGLSVALIDNTDTGDAKATGSWATSAPAGGGYTGTDFRTHAAATGSPDRFTWTVDVPADGTYTAYVKYPSVSGASTSAPFTIDTGVPGSVAVTKPVNQSTGAGTWVSLGQYTFAEASTGTISLAPAAGGTVVADAVKLVRDTTGETDTEKKDFAYTYDPNGNLVGIHDTQPASKVSDYQVTYNGLNQVATVVEKKGATLLKTSAYTYNENGAPLTRTFDDTGNKDDQYAAYTYDVRDLVAQVTNAKSATPGPSDKVTRYTYTARGQTDVETKANGNTVDSDYYLDGQLKQQVEKKSNGTLVSSHALQYSPNGDKVRDAAKVQNADNHAAYLDNVYTYTYDPRDRIAEVEKKDAAGQTLISTETYTHDANDNVIAQDVNNTPTSYSYDRNRLLTATTGGATASYTYDPFGRLQHVKSGQTVIERNTYDGYDRVVKHTALQDGTTKTTQTAYDPLDRTASKTEGTKTTNYNYLGLSGDVLSEEVAGKVTASYQYSPWGERLSQVKYQPDGSGGETAEDGYYGYNPHTDVETLTTSAGDTKATYGYTAYGKNDDTRYTGVDKPDAQQPGKEPYNVYRYNAKRWDPSSQTYDMGFRDYSPGINRFLTRDTYNGALADLNLGLDPWTANRYAFTAGNPVTRIELNGHCPMADEGGCDTNANYTGPTFPPPPTNTPVRTTNRPTTQTVAPHPDRFDETRDCNYAGCVYTEDLSGKYGPYKPNSGDYFGDFLWSLTPPAAIDDCSKGDKLACAGLVPFFPFKALKAIRDAERAADAAKDARAADEAAAMAKACRPGNSFTGDTLVLMADGTKKPIKDVKLGDKVMAQDPVTGKRGPQKVIDLIRHSGPHTMVKVRLADGTTIDATDEHPFWVANDQEWVDAVDLEPGDVLVEADGDRNIVFATLVTEEDLTAYNLTVDRLHTYYVGSSAVLVHNDDYNQAMRDALAWLEERGFRAERPTLGRFGDTQGMPIGMQTADGKIGFRVEFDNRNGAHINVWNGKEKGPHFTFDGTAKTVTKIQGQFGC